MPLLVIYDPDTGNIVGRVMCSDRQAENYRYKLQLTPQEFHERPELFRKVDVTKPDRPLIGLSVAEARKRGAPEDFIEAKIAAGKMKRNN